MANFSHLSMIIVQKARIKFLEEIKKVVGTILATLINHYKSLKFQTIYTIIMQRQKNQNNAPQQANIIKKQVNVMEMEMQDSEKMDQQINMAESHAYQIEDSSSSLMIDQSESQIQQHRKNKNYGQYFVGSLMVYGYTVDPIEPFLGTRELYLLYHTKCTNTSIQLEDMQQHRVKIGVLFAGNLYRLDSKDVGNVRYYYRSGVEFKEFNLVPVRLDIYINKKVFQPSFYQLPEPKYSFSQDTQSQQKIVQRFRVCQFLIYLIKKCNAKVLIGSLVVPSPKINFMMRQYRTATIGHKTKSARHPEKLEESIRYWKKMFSTFSEYYFCYCRTLIKEKEIDIDLNQYYQRELQKEQSWSFTRYLQDTQYYVLNKARIRLTQYSRSVMSLEQQSEMQKYRNVNLKEIGADIFIQNQSNKKKQNPAQQIQQFDQQQQYYNEQLNKKRNIELIKKFEQQNKYFAQHENPKGMLTQLKPYQLQALQWMKVREGKISERQLFGKKYIETYGTNYERKLSIFWQKIQLLSGQIIYINHLTGQFSKQFKKRKKIMGGILADQMGLGKTVMLLSLLADQGFQGTNLIIVPVNVLKQWQNQIKKHCIGQVKVFNFNQCDKKKRRQIQFHNYNIVLVTYATLASYWKELSYDRAQKQQSLMFNYPFRRIVLDQAHQIREVHTLQFQAVMNLKASFKWCLTGTIVQNTEKDLFPILKFLGVEFFSEEKWWNRYIKNSVNFQSKLNILYSILRPILLRRVKSQNLLQLSQKVQHIIKPAFSQNQQKIYRQLEKGAIKQLRLNLIDKKNCLYSFLIINKLREFCCHPQLIIGNYNAQDIECKSTEQIIKIFFSNTLSEQFKNTTAHNIIQCVQQACVICFCNPEPEVFTITKCGHIFCKDCILSQIQLRHKCPVCRFRLTQDDVVIKKELVEEEITKQDKANLVSIVNNSTKMNAIFEKIRQINQRNQKCIIFTNWVLLINLLEQEMKKIGFQYAMIKGSLRYQKREKQIQKFKTDANCRFLIISMKAGNIGLNLQVANNVIICDPWWNPTQQDQAIARVHRFGQEKVVNVYRFFMKNSIEQKIQKMHYKKKILGKQIMMDRQSLAGNRKIGVMGQLLELMNENNQEQMMQS